MSKKEEKDPKTLDCSPLFTLMENITAYAAKESVNTPPLQIAGALMASARNIYIKELGYAEANRLLQLFCIMLTINDDNNTTIH